MGGAREAVARVGEEPDVVTGRGAPAASAPAGKASAGGKVLTIVEGLVLLIALVLPWVLQDYLTVFATRVVILALFALSFDLVWGYAGIMSFGQALFFGAAGYGVALMARDLQRHVDPADPACRRADRAHRVAAAWRLPSARALSLERDLRLARHADRLLCR
ncbi:hypothetical protein ACVWY2_000573 [Bradyrhizobium sp. JR6.1]